MISEIELGNIRIFQGEGWNFKLKPFTVLCGTNGSGKSTILKVLLLLRQSIGTNEIFEKRGGRLQLSGTHVDFGNFCSLVSGNNFRNKISFSITINDFLNLDKNTFAELLPALFQKESEKNIIQDLYEFTLKAKFTFSLDEKIQDILSSDEGKKSEISITKDVFLDESIFSLSISDKNLEWKVQRDKARGIDYHILIPQKDLSILGPFNAIEYQDNGAGYFEALARVKGLLPDLMAGKSNNENRKREDRLYGEPVPILIQLTQDKLVESLNKFDYLGPFRSPAKRFYYLSQDLSLPQLDLSGEYIPQILFEKIDNKKYFVDFVLPRATKTERVTLGNALNTWIHYIRTGKNEASSKEIQMYVTKVLAELLIKGGVDEKMYPLADTGFGYSQVLPILVRGLLLPQNSCLVVEQPELHLNPALQVRLSEFLFAMVLSNKQVLIETHSEHIINSIRVITAESENDEITSLTSLYYIDIENSTPKIHELNIQQDGLVPNWPRAFFGEAADLTTRLLKAQKRFLKK